jgi:hypothetical protein
VGSRSVDQYRFVVELLSVIPGNVRGDRADTDATTRADDRDALLLVFDLLRRCGAGGWFVDPLQCQSERLFRHRLDHVIGRPGIDDLAIERYVVDRPDADDAGIFAESRGQGHDGGQR